MKSAGLHIVLGHCERTLYNNGTNFNHWGHISFTPPSMFSKCFIIMCLVRNYLNPLPSRYLMTSSATSVWTKSEPEAMNLSNGV